MKTSWTFNFLERHYGPQGAREFTKQMAAKYSEKHNVPFCTYESHSKYHVRPYLDMQGEMILDGYESKHEREMLEDISSEVKVHGKLSMYKIYEITGWPLSEVARTMRFMIKRLSYTAVVNRLGYVEAVKSQNSI